MRKLAVAALLVLAQSLPLAAVAGPPLAGVYLSADVGGPVQGGRYAEGWDAESDCLLAGTTFNGCSWDGSIMTVGAQWGCRCGAQVADATLIGGRTYAKVFAGGTFYLGAAGPWENGDQGYTGVFDSYLVHETVEFTGSDGSPYGVSLTIEAAGHFDDYPETCLIFSCQGSEVFDTRSDLIPAGYPGAVTSDCTSWHGAPYSGWDLHHVEFSITGCATGATDMTWGTIKALYD